jgi:L-arabinose isomerase
VLRRDGVIFETVTCAFGDLSRHGRLHRTLRALAVASLVRRATVLRVGEVQTGYDDVVADASALQRLGVREVSASLEDWTRAVASTPEASAAEMARRCGGWRRDRLDEAAMATSTRVAAALAGLVASSQADCGTVNCHSPYFRYHQELGVTACLAVTLLTEQGVPFSYTGDLPAALALLIGKRLAGAALYCELYTPETRKCEMAVAAGGEGDPALAANDTLRLIPNRMYPGPGGEGIGVAFSVVEGPATVISVGVGPDRWQVVWATGTVTRRDFPDFDGPHGGWRFGSGELEDCVTRWIAAGPSHHHALVPGHLDVEVPVVARAAAMDSVRV